MMRSVLVEKPSTRQSLASSVQRPGRTLEERRCLGTVGLWAARAIRTAERPCDPARRSTAPQTRRMRIVCVVAVATRLRPSIRASKPTICGYSNTVYSI